MRYYLHIRDGEKLIEDPDGAEFETLNEARYEALNAARDLLADLLRSGGILDGQRFEICNEAGDVLATIPFKDAIQLGSPVFQSAAGIGESDGGL